MPRAKIYGFIALMVAIILGFLFFYYAFFNNVNLMNSDLIALTPSAFYSISIPIAVVSLLLLMTGFWVGWTILTIKVAPPMPEIVEKIEPAPKLLFDMKKRNSMCHPS